MSRTFLRRRRVLHYVHLAESLECRRLLASINGTMYLDHDNNDAIDPSDFGWNCPVYVDLNNDGSPTEGEPYASDNTGGLYSLTDVPAGTYSVRTDSNLVFLTNPPVVNVNTSGSVINDVNVFLVSTYYAGSPSGTDFTLRANVGATKLELNTGFSTFTLPLNIPSITILANVGDDTLTLDYVNGNPIPANVSFNGGPDATGDSVIINGSSNADTFTLAAGSISDGGTVSYSNVESIDINAGETGNNTYQIESTAATTPLTITDTSGTNSFELGEGDLAELAGGVTITASPLDSILLDDGTSDHPAPLGQYAVSYGIQASYVSATLSEGASGFGGL